MKKWITVTIIALISVGLMAGCGSQAPGEEAAEDGADRNIIVLAPADLEILFTLGAEEYIVGRSDYCDYPEAAFQIASVGECLLPDTEKMVALKPDLIIAEQGLTDQDTLDGISGLGIEVMTNTPPQSMDELYDHIMMLGEVTGKTDEASMVVTDLQSYISESEEENSGVEPTSIYYVIDTGEYGEFAATGDTFINDIITAAGGYNVAESASGWMFSPELLITADPEVIVGSELNIGKIAGNPQYAEVRAVRTQRLYVIDDNLLSRPTPRAVLEGIPMLKDLLQ